MFIISSLVLQISFDRHWSSPALYVLAGWSRPYNKAGNPFFLWLEVPLGVREAEQLLNLIQTSPSIFWLHPEQLQE